MGEDNSNFAEDQSRCLAYKTGLVACSVIYCFNRTFVCKFDRASAKPSIGYVYIFSLLDSEALIR